MYSLFADDLLGDDAKVTRREKVQLSKPEHLVIWVLLMTTK